MNEKTLSQINADEIDAIKLVIAGIVSTMPNDRVTEINLAVSNMFKVINDINSNKSDSEIWNLQCEGIISAINMMLPGCVDTERCKH